MMVAEELDADWSKVHFAPAPVDPAYNHSVYGIQMTGGSTSTWSEWDRLRKAGATARAMLIAAAAQMWNVDPSTCTAANSQVTHSVSGRQTTYGKLVDRAAQLTPPSDAKLKDPKNFKLVGKPIKRLDTPEKDRWPRHVRPRCQITWNVGRHGRPPTGIRRQSKIVQL